MITTKNEFIRTFLPADVDTINFAQVDLDITDLSLADILRNANKSFPKNTRTRNAMASGTHAVGILCKSELLDPMSGLLLIITNGESPLQIVSRNYVVIGVPEHKIVEDEDIKEILEGITKYLISSFKETMDKFNEFYVKYIYDEYELEQLRSEDRENISDDYF